MTICNYKTGIIVVLLIAIMAGIVPVMAVPTTGVPTLIGPNNVTIPLTGVTGTEAWVLWGYNTEAYVWNTANYTPDGTGAVSVLVWGAPMMGDTLYFATGCDRSGCGNEVSFTTGTITPVPTTTFGAGFVNLSQSHWNLLYISPNIERVFTPAIPRTMLYGLLIGLIFLGIWVRTRSIRLCSTLGIILGSLIWSASSGLYLGIPLQEQLLGQVLLAAGIAGWVLALFVKK